MQSRKSFICLASAVMALSLSVVPTSAAGSGASFTPMGQNVAVSPLVGVELVFDQVLDPGETRVVMTDLGSEATTTPCGNSVPSYAALPVGSSTFPLYDITTDALFTDSVEVIIDHPDGNSRMLHAACPPDGNGFQPITTLAVPGDPRGRIPKFSEFLIISDLRPTDEILAVQLDRWREALAMGSPGVMVLDDNTLFILRSFGRDVFRALRENDKLRAKEILQDMIIFVRQESGVSIPNRDGLPGGNLAGELLSLGATIKFTLDI
jgi:hypothetical protein